MFPYQQEFTLPAGNMLGCVDQVTMSRKLDVGKLLLWPRVASARSLNLISARRLAVPTGVEPVFPD
jgi:hypothetical protein